MQCCCPLDSQGHRRQHSFSADNLGPRWNEPFQSLGQTAIRVPQESISDIIVLLVNTVLAVVLVASVLVEDATTLQIWLRLINRPGWEGGVHKCAHAMGEEIEQRRLYSTVGNSVLEESRPHYWGPSGYEFLALCSVVCNLPHGDSKTLSVLRDHLSVTQYPPLSTDTDREAVTCSSLWRNTIPSCLSLTKMECGWWLPGKPHYFLCPSIYKPSFLNVFVNEAKKWKLSIKK